VYWFSCGELRVENEGNWGLWVLDTVALELALNVDIY